VTAPDLTPEAERELMTTWLDSVAFTDTPEGPPVPDADDPDDDYAKV
jgi:hypothetical protein